MSAPDLVVALSGTRGTGKDTLFSLLARINSRFRRFAHADELKAELSLFLMEHFDINPSTATGADKELIRPILIAYGCAKRDVNPDHWVSKTIAQIQREWGNASVFYAPPIPVVTDNRFENEIDLLRRTYGSALRHIDITRDGAPPPTEEEEKHYRQVAALADYHLHWGQDDEEVQLRYARLVYSWLGLDMVAQTTNAEVYG